MYYRKEENIELSQANDYVKKMLSCEWVKWIHPGSMPAKTAAERKNYAENPAVNTRHCASCLNMNGCCFVKGNCPENPLHEHCHYETIEIIEVRATSVIEKYTKYIFDDENNEGKKALFESWGFSIYDSEYLKEEIERQARLAFQCGDYILGKRNEYGQRISIVIHLNRKDTGEEITFVTGWMSYPDGRIELNTPYGGKNERA